MTWTTPKTNWNTGELVTAADMNAMNENLAALKQPATAVYTTTADITADVREFTDIDSENLNLTLTTAGGDVLVHFHGSITQRDNHTVYLDIKIDEALLGGADGTLVNQLPNPSGSNHGTSIVSFTRLIQNLSAGSHTFKLQWKGTTTQILKVGAQFWAREI